MTNQASKLRVNTLMDKVDSLEKHLTYLEEQKYLFMLALPCDYDNPFLIKNAAEDCLIELTKILGEIRYIKRMDEIELEICLN